MKKLLVIALSVVMVLAFAAFAMADGNMTFVGNVNAEYNTLDSIANGYGDVWAYVAMTKDFTEGWTGGLNFKIVPGKTSTQLVPVVDPVTGLPVDADGDGNMDTVTITYQNGDAIAWDGQGFIKYSTDMYNVSFKTGIDAGVGLDLNDKGKIAGDPGVEFNITPMEGFTGSLILNETAEKGLTAGVGVDSTKVEFNYLLKGVYDLNGLKVGLGYQKDAQGTSVATDDVTTLGLFGSYKIMDSLTAGLEYQSRQVDTNDAEVGMKVYANYTQDALSASLTYATRTAGFYTKDDKSSEQVVLSDRFWDKTTAAVFGTEDTNSLISVAVSYKLSDALTAGLNVDTTSAKFNGTTKAGVAVTDASTGYKLYVTDQIVPDLSLEAGYQSFIDSKVYVKLSAKIN